MPSLSAIEYTLTNILGAVKMAVVDAEAAARLAKPGEHEHRQIELKLAAWLETLYLARRELLNMAHGAQGRLGRLHQLPRAARYGEKQSAQARLHNVAAMQVLLARINRLLLKLDAARHDPTKPADIVEGLQSVAEEWAQAFDRTQAAEHLREMRVDGPTWRPQPEPRVAASDLANQVLFGLLLAAWLLKRLKR